MNILIAESNYTLGKLIEYALKSAHHQVTLVEEGKQALNALRRFSFDLVITEILLPFYSGLELIHFIHEIHPSNSPKILVLTRIHNENTVSRAFDLGIDDYILKPFDLDFLTLTIQKLSFAKTQKS